MVYGVAGRFKARCCLQPVELGFTAVDVAS